METHLGRRRMGTRKPLRQGVERWTGFICAICPSLERPGLIRRTGAPSEMRTDAGVRQPGDEIKKPSGTSR